MDGWGRGSRGGRGGMRPILGAGHVSPDTDLPPMGGPQHHEYLAQHNMPPQGGMQYQHQQHQQMQRAQGYPQPQVPAPMPPRMQMQAPMQPKMGQTNFNLNAEAAVFVPRGYAKAPNGMPDMSVPPPQIAASRNQDPAPSLTRNQDPLTQLKQAISALTSNPEDFDAVIGPLTQSLSVNVVNEQTMMRVIEEIFTQSVQVNNFRYTGARMCHYFSQNLTNEFPSGNFRQLLLKRCHEEHKKSEDMAKNCDTHLELIGFTLFMGELLLNLTDAKGEKMSVLVGALQQLLMTIISHPTEAFLRCIVQVLKLSGGTIDKGRPPIMDSIFENIKETVLSDSTRKSIRAVLVSVIELRASNWNDGTSSSQSASSGSSSGAVNYSAPASVPAGMPGGSGGAPGAPPMQPQMNPQHQQQQQQQQQQPPQQPQQPGQQQVVYYDENGQPLPMPYGEDFFPEDEVYDEYGGDGDWSQGQDVYQDGYFLYDQGYALQDGNEMDDEIAAAFEDFILQQNKS